MAMLTEEHLLGTGFLSLGKNILVSDRATFYGISRISIGDNVRIDDFCVISAGSDGIAIGNHVHIACFCSLIGAARITLSDFSGLSSRVSIYSSSDDYSGNALTNPTVPAQYTNVQHGNVLLGRHVIIGSGSVILPGCTLDDGAAVGALSLVNKDLAAFGIYSGHPARRIGERSHRLQDLEADLRGQMS